MRRIALLTVAFLVAIPSVQAAPARVSAEEFAGRLLDAERLAETGGSDPTPESMDAVVDALGLPATVVFAAGDSMAVARDPYFSGLAGTQRSHFERAAQHIGAMRVAFERARTATPPDRAAVRSALRRAYAGVSASPGLIRRIRRAITSALQSFLETLFSSGGLGAFVAWAIVAVLLAAGIWGLTRLAVPQRRVRKRAPLREEDIDWRRLAEEALARGDHPEAVRARYRLLLQALASQGILRDSPSLTAGECRRSVRRCDRPALIPPVDQATAVFERVAYGEQPLRPGELEAMQRAEEAVRSR